MYDAQASYSGGKPLSLIHICIGRGRAISHRSAARSPLAVARTGIGNAGNLSAPAHPARPAPTDPSRIRAQRLHQAGSPQSGYAFLPLPAHRAAAVSYTHLDVYKRQDSLFANQDNNPIQSDIEVLITSKPDSLSLTNLDDLKSIGISRCV